MSDKQLQNLSVRVGQELDKNRYLLVTAESCTGGGLSEAVTRIPGSSAWFDRGFITYSNQSKVTMLNVSEDTLQQYGAISENTAIEMAQGALDNSIADIAVAITGIAGPGGATQDKPVGLVCFAWLDRDINMRSTHIIFKGDRLQIRHQACLMAMQGILDLIDR